MTHGTLQTSDAVTDLSVQQHHERSRDHQPSPPLHCPMHPPGCLPKVSRSELVHRGWMEGKPNPKSEPAQRAA